MTKQEFLEGVQNWDNHRRVLWPSLMGTMGDIVEMGMGQGSTPFLHDFVQHSNRKLFSYDNNLEWSNKFKHLETDKHKIFHVTDWDDVFKAHKHPHVVLIDHAPGERRWEDIKKYANNAKIICIHDSEPAATGYMLYKIWHLFKYRIDYKTDGAWASAVSNFIDVTKFQL
jgi:hypothetical protein